MRVGRCSSTPSPARPSPPPTDSRTRPLPGRRPGRRRRRRAVRRPHQPDRRRRRMGRPQTDRRRHRHPASHHPRRVGHRPDAHRRRNRMGLAVHRPRRRPGVPRSERRRRRSAHDNGAIHVHRQPRVDRGWRFGLGARAAPDDRHRLDRQLHHRRLGRHPGHVHAGRADHETALPPPHVDPVNESRLEHLRCRRGEGGRPLPSRRAPPATTPSPCPPRSPWPPPRR